MSYYVGDIPAEDLVIEPARNQEPIDLTPFDTVTVSLTNSMGEVIETAGFLATIDEVTDQVIVEWPDDSPFATAGLYLLGLVLEGSISGRRERIAPVPLVVDVEDDGWHNLDSFRDSWVDAPQTDVKAYELLWVAKNAVLSFAPALEIGQRPPLSYKLGQAMQARNLWNAAKVDPASGGLGEDSFVIRPFPLDWMIRQVLRPKTAIPAVG